jgi:FMN reductase
MNITSLLGSPSTASRCAAMLQFAQSRLRPLAERIDEVALRELPGQSLLLARFGDPALRVAMRQVRDADVVLIATPIVKGSYSGLLKAFLDLLPHDGLRGKTVLTLAAAGDALAAPPVDALRPVLRSLGARQLLDTVHAGADEITALEFGGYRVGHETRRRIDAALTGLVGPAWRERPGSEAWAAAEADALLARVWSSARRSATNTR